MHRIDYVWYKNLCSEEMFLLCILNLTVFFLVSKKIHVADYQQ